MSRLIQIGGRQYFICSSTSWPVISCTVLLRISLWRSTRCRGGILLSTCETPTKCKLWQKGRSHTRIKIEKWTMTDQRQMLDYAENCIRRSHQIHSSKVCSCPKWRGKATKLWWHRVHSAKQAKPTKRHNNYLRHDSQTKRALVRPITCQPLHRCNCSKMNIVLTSLTWAKREREVPSERWMINWFKP